MTVTSYHTHTHKLAAHSPKCHILLVHPWSGTQGDVELATVCILARIGHPQHSTAVMRDCKALICQPRRETTCLFPNSLADKQYASALTFKGRAIDGLPPSSTASTDI